MGKAILHGQIDNWKIHARGSCTKVVFQPMADTGGGGSNILVTGFNKAWCKLSAGIYWLNLIPLFYDKVIHK